MSDTHCSFYIGDNGDLQLQSLTDESVILFVRLGTAMHTLSVK